MENLNTPLPAAHPATMLTYCPFCGSSAFTWDGVKSHTCPTCRMQLFTNPAAAVAAIIENERGDILFVRRRYEPAASTLDLPGGFVDIDETAEHAIAREVHEEVGLHIHTMRPWRTFANRYLYGGLLYFTTDIVYICTIADFSTLRAADDAAECLFLPKNSIDISAIGLASIKNVVRAWLGMSTSAV